MTVLQRYFNMEPTYSSVVVMYILAMHYKKKTDLNRYVTAVIYHCALKGSIAVTVFVIYFCFQNDCG